MKSDVVPCAIILVVQVIISCAANNSGATRHRFRIWTRVNPNCSGIRSNLYVLSGWAIFWTSIDTQCFLFSWSQKYLNLPFLYTLNYIIFCKCVTNKIFFSSLLGSAENTRETQWKRAFPERLGEGGVVVVKLFICVSVRITSIYLTGQFTSLSRTI